MSRIVTKPVPTPGTFTIKDSVFSVMASSVTVKLRQSSESKKENVRIVSCRVASFPAPPMAAMQNTHTHAHTHTHTHVTESRIKVTALLGASIFVVRVCS